MQQIKALIIDDEALARQRLANLLKDIPEIYVVDECKNGSEAIKKIEKILPDLIFLDLQMKDMTGFDVLESIKVPKKPLVIFVTAYDEFALKAFDYFAFDYLLKPYKDERFFKSTTQVIQYINQNNNIEFEKKLKDLMNYIKQPSEDFLYSHKDKLPIKLGNKVSFINVKDIKYVSASGYYAEIHTKEKQHLLRESLSNLINELPLKNFIRIHRSTIVNTEYIQELISSNYGEVDVKMKDNKLFRISKSYKKVFLSKVGL